MEEVYDEQNKEKDYSRTWSEGIRLVSQTDSVRRRTSYENLTGGAGRQEEYSISYRMVSVAEAVRKIRTEFRMRDWEGGILGLGDEEVYSRNHLPPKEKIEEIIRRSMEKVGIAGDELTEENAHKIYQAFSTLFRKKAKTVVQKQKNTEPFPVSTEDMPDSAVSLSAFRNDATLFYTDDFESAAVSDDQRKVVRDFLEDENFPKKSLKEVNPYLFKTPQNFVITSRTPERTFVEALCQKENARHISAWIKSRDTGFYSIAYTYKIGSHQKQKEFNPDFFLWSERDEESVCLVVEIKEDRDDSAENRAKYRHACLHFAKLNEELEKRGIHERYLFHFLSPKDYHVFFRYLRDGRLFVSQENFRCELENMLEEAER